MPLLRASLCSHWFVFYRQPSEFLMLNLPNLPALPSLLLSSLQGRTWKFPSAEGDGVTELMCVQGRIGRECSQGPAPREPVLATHDPAQLWAPLGSPEQNQKQLRGSAKCRGTIFHGNYASTASASCLGIRNSPTGFCSKEGKRWRPEPKTNRTDQRWRIPGIQPC